MAGGLGASFVFSEAEAPQLWPFGMLVGFLETAPLPRTRSFLGRKVKRAPRSWSQVHASFMSAVSQPQLSQPVDQRARVYPSALLSLVLGESVLQPPWGVHCEKGAQTA